MLPRAPLTPAPLQTYTIDRQVPDSAGTGTAYLCGVKTNAKTLGLSGAAAYGKCRTTFGNEVDSVLHRARLAGTGGRDNPITEPGMARTGFLFNPVPCCRQVRGHRDDHAGAARVPRGSLCAVGQPELVRRRRHAQGGVAGRLQGHRPPAGAQHGHQRER